MRDTSLVTEKTTCASWAQSVYCTGETFEPGHEPFLPRYDTDTTAILFPPALPDQAVFRTLLLKNCGDTPMSFCFEDDPMGIFRCGIAFSLVHIQLFFIIATLCFILECGFVI